MDTSGEKREKLMKEEKMCKRGPEEENLQSVCGRMSVRACLMTDKAKLAMNYRCSRGEIFMKMLLSHSKISQTTSDKTWKMER